MNHRTKFIFIEMTTEIDYDRIFVYFNLAYKKGYLDGRATFRSGVNHYNYKEIDRFNPTPKIRDWYCTGYKDGYHDGVIGSVLNEAHWEMLESKNYIKRVEEYDKLKEYIFSA